MLFGVIIEWACGALCIALGIILWVKKKTSLLHDYHYTNVKEDDVPAYARLMGIGLIVIGIGIAAAGALDLFHSPLWWIPLGLGFVAGVIVMHTAQKKYNGSWFG